MADSNANPLPGFPVHPGLFLREELEAREMSVDDLAQLVSRSVGELLAIVNERALIDRSLAEELSGALGTSAVGWVNSSIRYCQTLERDYRRDSVAEAAVVAD